MLLWGLAAGLAAWFLGRRGVALGVAAGMPVAILNYYLLARAVTRGHAGVSPRKAQNFFMTRALLRMLIALATLAAAVAGGPQFVLGVMAALVTQMLSYLGEAFQLILRRG